MQAISANRITQAQHGTSKAVDYSPTGPSGDGIYAPEDAIFDSYMQRGTGTGDAGNALRIRGANGLHQFGHCETSYIKAGDKVKRGQLIAKMGYTGYTIPKGPAGAHCHWWILRDNGTYVYPPSIVNEGFIKLDGGDTTMVTRQGLEVIYRYRLGRDPDDSAYNHYVGKQTFDFTDNDVKASKEAQILVDAAKARNLDLQRFMTLPIRQQIPSVPLSLLDQKPIDNPDQAKRIAELEKQLAERPPVNEKAENLLKAVQEAVK